MDQPSEADQIRLVSYNTLRAVTPYFISTKCAHAYGKFIIDQVKLGNTITKEEIIKTITKLETFNELRLDISKTLPAAIIDTTLNLPPGTEEHFLTAHLGDVEVAAPMVESVPITAYLGATTQPPIKQPISTANEQHRARKASKSPNRKPPDKDKPRGRSPAKNPTSTARSSSYEAEIEILQYYSDRSTSPVQTSVKMPSIYRRPMTPDSFAHLKQNYFQPTSAAKFKDVWLLKRCLRCYSDKHRARECPRFTKPTPIPCSYCWYLFHDSATCPFYDKTGKSRPNSIDRST